MNNVNAKVFYFDPLSCQHEYECGNQDSYYIFFLTHVFGTKLQILSNVDAISRENVFFLKV
jgi:hypothetical protein